MLLSDAASIADSAESATASVSSPVRSSSARSSDDFASSDAASSATWFVRFAGSLLHSQIGIPESPFDLPHTIDIFLLALLARLRLLLQLLKLIADQI